MKRHSLIVAGLLLGFMLVLNSSAALTQAADAPVAEPGKNTTADPGYVGLTVAPPFQNKTEANNACEAEMNDFAEKLFQDYLNFVELNFQNKSSTSSLMDTAIGKYREMRHNLYTAYYQYFPNEGSFILATNPEPSTCLKIIEDTLFAAKTVLKKHAVKTSTVKKATAILEKYQALNNQIGELHRQFMFMRAYLDNFATKLPCYVKSACVK